MLARAPGADLFGESPLLTRLDLSDDEVVKDAAHQLERCLDDFQLASWARRWGRVMVDRLRGFEGLDHGAVDADVHADVERAREDAETCLNELIEAADKAIDRIRETLAGSSGPKTDALMQVASDLETAVEASSLETEA